MRCKDLFENTIQDRLEKKKYNDWKSWLRLEEELMWTDEKNWETAKKVILACRSPYFLVILTSDMIEKEYSKLEINDIDYETMKQ